MSGEVDPPDGGDDQVSAAMSNPEELIEEQDNKGPTINHLDFSVEYISPDTMPRPALQVLGRKTDEIEEAYTAACGKVYRCVFIAYRKCRQSDKALFYLTHIFLTGYHYFQ